MVAGQSARISGPGVGRGSEANTLQKLEAENSADWVFFFLINKEIKLTSSSLSLFSLFPPI